MLRVALGIAYGSYLAEADLSGEQELHCLLGGGELDMVYAVDCGRTSLLIS